MRIVECGGQGTAGWFNAHLGKLTSSRIASAVAKRKRGTEDFQCRTDLRLDLAIERITRKPTEHFVSEWMERGIEMEPLARAAYELRDGITTKQVDFVLHPTIEEAGCSPDGLVGEDGLVEFKVPKPSTHAKYLLGEVVPALYVPQMMWQMACCERDWNIFVSYCPDFPEPLDLFVCTLNRDAQMIGQMEDEARTFLAEVGILTKRLGGGLEAVLRESVIPKAVIPPIG